MDRLSINNIHKLDALQNETEHERALSLYLKLRKLEKEDSSYSSVRKHLRTLIHRYEKEHWSDVSKINEKQVKESDAAEKLVQSENEFYKKRKSLLKNKMNTVGLNQNDLARLLSHRKGYMSELINGLRPFSKEDLIVVSKLLKIKLEDLIPPFIKQERALHIQKTLQELNKKVKLRDTHLWL